MRGLQEEANDGDLQRLGDDHSHVCDREAEHNEVRALLLRPPEEASFAPKKVLLGLRENECLDRVRTLANTQRGSCHRRLCLQHRVSAARPEVQAALWQVLPRFFNQVLPGELRNDRDLAVEGLLGEATREGDERLHVASSAPRQDHDALEASAIRRHPSGPALATAYPVHQPGRCLLVPDRHGLHVAAGPDDEESRVAHAKRIVIFLRIYRIVSRGLAEQQAPLASPRQVAHLDLGEGDASAKSAIFVLLEDVEAQSPPRRRLVSLDEA
mmetsp:Transcript_2051/g.5314  ORF Transcript_2051/g.5314 Transcript_2051/m.5314 type:complete len:270 (-) Transcript_2051:122-931(-)